MMGPVRCSSRDAHQGGAGLCQDSGKFRWDCWGCEIPKPELTGMDTGTLGPLASPSKGWCPRRVAGAPRGMKPCPPPTSLPAAPLAFTFSGCYRATCGTPLPCLLDPRQGTLEDLCIHF